MLVLRCFRRSCTLAIKALSFVLLILSEEAVCAEPVKTESGLIQGTVEDELFVYQGIQAMSEIIILLGPTFPRTVIPMVQAWPAYGNANLQAMHFLAGTAQAGPMVNEEGLKTLDAYFK